MVETEGQLLTARLARVKPPTQRQAMLAACDRLSPGLEPSAGLPRALKATARAPLGSSLVAVFVKGQWKS